MHRLDLRRHLFDRDVLSLMGLGLLVKPLGLVTQILLARWFGAGEQLDAYQLAFFLVTFGDGTLSRVFKGALAPHLIQRLREMEALAYARYQNGVVGLFVGAGAVWLVLLAGLAGLVIGAVWPGLPDVTSRLTVQMLLVMALPGLLMVANNLGIAVLNLHQHFRVAGTMPVLNAACVLLALVLWHDRLGIWSMPVGFALSHVLQWPLIHVRALVVRAWRPVRPSLAGADLRLIRDLVALMAVAEVLLTINLFVDRWFATGLEPGSISSLAYAYTITNTVLILFSTSLITVIFPRMSAAIAAGDLAGCSADIRANLNRTAHLVVPAALMAAVAAPEIVRVLFQRGAFDAVAAVRTSGTMSMYVLGLPALIINGLVARIFHSLQLLRDKMWLSLQYLLTNVLFNALLIGPLAVQGLALASTIAINLHLGLSLWILHRRRSGLTTGRFSGIVAVSYALGAVTLLGYRLLPVEAWTAALRPETFGGALAVCAMKAGVIGGIYGPLAVVWRRASR
ncbi:MAG: lipid II flippase MurJ [Candidatus Krumholzibacteriia bacterium]